MELKTWNVPMVQFLATDNTIKITSKEELEAVKEKVKSIGLDLKRLDWDYIRRNTRGFKGYICLEYDNYKGCTYYTDEEESIRWYEKQPITVKDII